MAYLCRAVRERRHETRRGDGETPTTSHEELRNLSTMTMVGKLVDIPIAFIGLKDATTSCKQTEYVLRSLFRQSKLSWHVFSLFYLRRDYPHILDCPKLIRCESVRASTKQWADIHLNICLRAHSHWNQFCDSDGRAAADGYGQVERCLKRMNATMS